MYLARGGYCGTYRNSPAVNLNHRLMYRKMSGIRTSYASRASIIDCIEIKTRWMVPIKEVAQVRYPGVVSGPVEGCFCLICGSTEIEISTGSHVGCHVAICERETEASKVTIALDGGGIRPIDEHTKRGRLIAPVLTERNARATNCRVVIVAILVHQVPVLVVPDDCRRER